jgi:hypothetical protein
MLMELFAFYPVVSSQIPKEKVALESAQPKYNCVFDFSEGKFVSFKVKDGGQSVSIIMGLVVPLNEDFFNRCRKKFKNYKIVDMGLAVNKKEKFLN